MKEVLREEVLPFTPWDNLVDWLRLVHAGKDALYIASKPVQPDASNFIRSVRQQFIGGMFVQVVELRDLPWKRMLKVLESLRPGLEKLVDRFVAAA